MAIAFVKMKKNHWIKNRPIQMDKYFSKQHSQNFSIFPKHGTKMICTFQKGFCFLSLFACLFYLGMVQNGSFLYILLQNREVFWSER